MFEFYQGDREMFIHNPSLKDKDCVVPLLK